VTCKSDQCCIHEATCSDFVCPNGFLTRSGYCGSPTCTTEQCCVREATCDDYNCPQGFFQTSHAPCGSTGCDLEQCCRAEGTCNNFFCPEGYVKTPSVGCQKATCDLLQCCAPSASCVDSNVQRATLTQEAVHHAIRSPVPWNSVVESRRPAWITFAQVVRTRYTAEAVNPQRALTINVVGKKQLVLITLAQLVQ